MRIGFNSDNKSGYNIPVEYWQNCDEPEGKLPKH